LDTAQITEKKLHRCVCGRKLTITRIQFKCSAKSKRDRTT